MGHLLYPYVENLTTHIVLGTFSEVGNFIRSMTQLLYDHVRNTNDPFWQWLLEIRDFLRYILSPELSETQLVAMNEKLHTLMLNRMQLTRIPNETMKINNDLSSDEESEKSDSKSESTYESKSESESESNSILKSKSKSKLKTKLKAKLKTKSKSEVKSRVKSKLKKKSKSKSKYSPPITWKVELFRLLGFQGKPCRYTNHVGI